MDVMAILQICFVLSIVMPLHIIIIIGGKHCVSGCPSDCPAVVVNTCSTKCDISSLNGGIE